MSILKRKMRKEIELAEVKMQEVFAQQYEDACKAREEEGANKNC